MKNNKTYIQSVHKAGRIWSISALAMLIMVPLSICIKYNAWPELQPLMKGMLGVVPMFWTVGTIEVITYVPMLGTGGSYLGFVTGNVTNLKVPCALNAMQIAGVTADSEEGEVLSTISIAVSSITTVVIIALGVVFLTPLKPFLESELLQPAFDNILPALFGGLAVVYISQNWKIALAPLFVMIALFIAIPSLASSVGLLVPVGAAVAIGVARILYKKGKL